LHLTNIIQIIMPLKAAIDIGTNSTRLLIASQERTRITPVTFVDSVTRLGENFDGKGNLTAPAMQRVIDALLKYKNMIVQAGVAETIVFATSATREAANGAAFIAEIARQTGFNCRVISGLEEARLSFKGVISDIPVAKDCVVCDVGGGSTEFVYTNSSTEPHVTSLKIGSRRAITRFIRNDPMTEDEMRQIVTDIKDELHQHLPGLTPQACISVGGTATTLAMIDNKISCDNQEKAHNKILKLKNLEIIIRELFVKTIQERKQIIGLHPDRADVIITGAIIVRSILEHFKLDECRVSLRDLLFGVMLPD